MPRQKSTTPKMHGAVSLDGFSRYHGLEECIAFASRALERAGGYSEHELPEHQRRLFGDLRDPLDEDVLAGMLSCSDDARIFER